MTLSEVRRYWIQKYPNVYVSIWEDKVKEKYRGLLSSCGSSRAIHAESVGEFILKGEEFIREMQKNANCCR